MPDELDIFESAVILASNYTGTKIELKSIKPVLITIIVVVNFCEAGKIGIFVGGKKALVTLCRKLVAMTWTLWSTKTIMLK